MNKLLLSNEAILIALCDYLTFIFILGVKPVLTYYFSNHMLRQAISDYGMKYLTKSFLYNRQGRSSLIIFNVQETGKSRVKKKKNITHSSFHSSRIISLCNFIFASCLPSSFKMFKVSP